MTKFTNDVWKMALLMVDPQSWMGALFLAVLIGLLAWLLGEGFRLLVLREAEKQPVKTDPTGLIFVGQLARVSVWLVAFLVYSRLVPTLMNLLDPNTLLGAVIYAVIVGLVAWLIGGALRLAVHRVLEKRGESGDQMAVRFLGQLSRVAVWIFAFVSYAHMIPPLQKMGGAWLTSAGVAAVVVGMAAQNTLGNLIAGISLVLYRPFHLGDHLQITAPGGVETGVVESISLGYTIVRAGDERRLVIPNSVMAGQTIVNLSMSSQPVPCAVVITLEHDADADRARQLLLGVAQRHPRALGTPTCRITSLTGAGVDACAVRPQVSCGRLDFLRRTGSESESQQDQQALHDFLADRSANLKVVRVGDRMRKARGLRPTK